MVYKSFMSGGSREEMLSASWEAPLQPEPIGDQIKLWLWVTWSSPNF